MQLLEDVLHLIMEATIPESIESLALTCWSIYNASEASLPRYNKLYRPFRHIDYSERDEELAYFDLLERIIDDPLVARSVVSAYFMGAFEKEPVPEPKPPDGWSIEPLRSIIAQSWYLERAGVDPEEFLDSWRMTPWKPHGYIFLFTLLPNISELSLPRGWDRLIARFQPYAENNWKILNAIMERANDPMQPSAGLSRLTTLKPSGRSVHLNSYLPFLSLTSLRNLHLFSCHQPDHHKSNPFKLERYSNLGQHLELRKIELDIRLLLGSRPCSQPFRKFSHEVPTQDHNNETGTPKLTNLLPQSVQSFVLLTDLQEENVDAVDQLFADFGDEAGAMLPQLRTVTIMCSLNGSTYGGSDCAERDPYDSRWQRIEKALEAVAGKMIEVDGDVQAEFMTTCEERFGTPCRD